MSVFFFSIQPENFTADELEEAQITIEEDEFFVIIFRVSIESIV